MAGTGASGKTPDDLTQTRTTVALVANERAGSSEAARCAERLRAFGAEVMRFGIDEIDDAAASGADRLVVAGGDGSIAPVAAAAGRAGIPLAVVPGRDGQRFRAAARAAHHRLRPPAGWRCTARAPVDGARLDERRAPFVNVASAGLPVPAAERAAAGRTGSGRSPTPRAR